MAMTKPEKRKLQRVQYWQGQMLRAQDFLNLQGVEAQRRWWHNRAIHNAYGVSEGLEANLTGSVVSVSPGVAYDIFGRELILERAQTVALPTNVPTDDPPMTLLVRYLPPGHNLSPDEITEVCWMQRGSVRPGTLVFIWKVASCVTPADGVAIFNLIYMGGETTESGLTVEPIPTQNQSFSPIGAEDLSRPMLASGATVPGQTAWEPWTAGFHESTGGTAEFPILTEAGVQTWVDTSAAGFTDCPCYFAWLEGPLFNSLSQFLLPALIPNVADESITGFTFRMWLPPPPIYGAIVVDDRRVLLANLNSNVVNTSLFDLFAQQQDLYVSWIGCQMPGKACSCSPQSVVATQSSTPVQT
ncbi:MAG TPA: hypothetical protein VN946_08470 [Terriglobales bacterium]|jgi:hypothetical protein|nr:hypothetical protein [Terriglobales bacterium]